MTASDAAGPEQAAIMVAGVSNFRDFGGYAAADGTRLPVGRLYRSAHLGRIAAGMGAGLSRLGIRTVIDLRGREERLKALPILAGDDRIDIVSAPIEPGSFTSMLLPDGASVTPELMRERIVSIYERYAGDAAPEFGRALTAVLDAAEAPLLIHCTAGKDRTGFTVALIQTLLGVPQDAVTRDYLLTNERWDRVYEGSARFTPDILAPALAADEAYLRAAFAGIAAHHGSAERYAAQATGIPDYAARLRRKLFSD